MTAIATVGPFTDDFLGDLMPLLRHRAALGLWRLTTAVTSTVPEQKVLVEAEAIRSRMMYETLPRDHLTPEQEHLLLVADALEEDVAWHSPERFRAAARLARRLLAGPAAEAGERMLHDQADEWSEQYQDALQSEDPAALSGRAPRTTGPDAAAPRCGGLIAASTCRTSRTGWSAARAPKPST